MAAFQKRGVIFVTVILTILQKIKSQNYRLYVLLEDSEKPGALEGNLTQRPNDTISLYAEESVSNFMYQCLLVSNCLAIIPCLFLTSWSDKHGRKLLLILPYVGSFISDIFMLVVLFVPLATRKFLLISEGINGILGGTSLMILGCLCYVTDSTDHRERTFLIAAFLGLYNITPVLDMSLQFFWTPEIGLAFRDLILSAVISRMVFEVFFLLYVKLFICESVFILGTYHGNPWTNLLTPINVSDTINCVFKRRHDNMRYYIIILTVIFILYTISLFGNISFYPLFFKSKFLWPYKDVLVFSAIFTASQTLALWIAMYLASELSILDSDLGIYGCLSLGMSCLILIFGKESYIDVIGALVGVGSLFVPVTILSVLSKLVERNETGSMYAGIGFLTLMTQLVASASYSALYDLCREAGVPELVFMFSFGLISFCLFFFIFLKRSISPHLLGHLNGSECLNLICRKEQIEQTLE